MMPQNSHSYLETQVLTSPPQKLQLILIEAAIRFAKKAEMLRTQGGDEAEACVAIGRAQKIVSEIISGLNQEVDPELVGQIASIYIFISQALVKANLPENSQQLADAIRILEEERITWRLVCEKLAAESADQNEAAMLHQQTREVEATETDSVVMNATAGNANVTNTSPLSMSPATYSPTPFFNLGGSSITGVSGPSKLSGPTKQPTETTAETPTSGFSIDA